MSRRRFSSLQLRLAWRLAVAFIVATAMVVGLLVYQTYDTAVSLSDRQLTLRADDLARSVSVDSSRVPRLALPPKLSAAYETASNADVFAIRTQDGRVVAASPAPFGDQVAGWPIATEICSYFHLARFGPNSEDYYGLSVLLNSAAGPLSITVAHADESNQLIHSLLRGFVVHIGWLIPIFVTITLATGVLAIRSGLRPVREVSQMASAIGPGATSIRLPETNLPSEITPLVTAVNRALDRLEQGFVVQRQFTANAAHELRTPLAIVTGALDAWEGNGEVAKLKGDVARMNRIVEQLLRVARLDAIALDVSGTVELNEVAASVVENMAPWVIEQRRTLAFAGTGLPVTIQGNVHAIEDAIRNLVENAVAHSPPGEEVVVGVHSDGRVSVADRGSGVPVEHRDRMFDRFWRGKGSGPGGAGLGLAIVQEIMKAHFGTVAVTDNAPRGAVFALSFARVEAPAAEHREAHRKTSTDKHVAKVARLGGAAA
jgi:signal transduction histidine kinase